MKVSMVTILIVSLLALAACSGEDQPPPQTPSPKVVQPIKPSMADVEKPTTTFAEEKKPQGEEKKPQAEEKAAREKPASAPEKPEVAPKPEAEDKKVASEEPTTAQGKKKEKDEPGIYRYNLETTWEGHQGMMPGLPDIFQFGRQVAVTKPCA